MFADTMEMTEKKTQEPLISIRDAARIIGVPPHTIRYWEKEFSDFLVAPRTMGKQRRYGDAQIIKLRTIFRMLKEDGYSIAGAKRALAKQNQAANLANSQANGTLETLSAEMAEKILAMVKNELITNSRQAPLLRSHRHLQLAREHPGLPGIAAGMRPRRERRRRTIGT